MSVSKERRRQLRERVSEARSGQSFGSVTPWDDIEALLDMADERDRYRALLDGARDSLVIFEQVLSDHFPESSVGLLVHRTRRERIDAALEGKE